EGEGLVGHVASGGILQLLQFFLLAACLALASQFDSPLLGSANRPIRAVWSDRLSIVLGATRGKERPPGAFARATNATWPTTLLSAGTKALAERESGLHLRSLRLRPLACVTGSAGVRYCLPEPLPDGNSGKAEAEVVAPVGRRAPVADRRPAVGADDAPAAAP